MRVTGPPRLGNGTRVVVVIGLGLALGLWTAATQGISVAAEYYAAYFLEKMLSVDNIFVFLQRLRDVDRAGGACQSRAARARLLAA